MKDFLLTLYWFCLCLLVVLAAAMWISAGQPVGIAFGQDMPQHPAPGQKHWYDQECCSERDCRPALPGEISADFERGGWVAHGQFIKWESHKDRESKDPNDPRMHICIARYGEHEVLCIYKPAARG